MIIAWELLCKVCNKPGTCTHTHKPHLSPPANSPVLSPWGRARRQAARDLLEP